MSPRKYSQDELLQPVKQVPKTNKLWRPGQDCILSELQTTPGLVYSLKGGQCVYFMTLANVGEACCVASFSRLLLSKLSILFNSIIFLWKHLHTMHWGVYPATAKPKSVTGKVFWCLLRWRMADMEAGRIDGEDEGWRFCSLVSISIMFYSLV